MDPKVLGVSFIYKLKRARTEPCGNPACILRGVDISPSAVILNVLLERNKLISFIMQTEKCNTDSLCNNSGCQVVSKPFRYQRIPQLYTYCYLNLGPRDP